MHTGMINYFSVSFMCRAQLQELKKAIMKKRNNLYFMEFSILTEEKNEKTNKVIKDWGK